MQREASTWSLVQAAPNAPPASPSTVTLKRPVGVRFDESCAGGRSLRRQFAGRSPGCGSGQVLHPPHPYSDPWRSDDCQRSRGAQRL